MLYILLLEKVWFGSKEKRKPAYARECLIGLLPQQGGTFGGKVARCPWPGTELTGMDVSCLRYTKTHLSHLEHNLLTRTQNSERISFKNYISLTRSKIHIHTHIFTRIGLSYAHTFLSFRHPQFNIQLRPSFHINKSDVRT